MQNKKRILSVTIKRMVDDSPDTSWLGEYSNTPTSEFSIDRAHSEDCTSIEANHREAVDKLERAITYLNGVRCEYMYKHYDLDTVSDFESAVDTLIEAQDSLMECDCGEHGDMNRGEYRYFNPSFNYVDKDGHASDGNTPEEVRKYVRQDYERMEDLNNRQWCFIGITAQADVILTRWQGTSKDNVRPVEIEETVDSRNALYGIESDCDKLHMAELEKEQLDSLKSELSALGFSKRAIATAFKNVKEEEN